MSYLRDTDNRLESGLPSIRRTQAWESTVPNGARRIGLDTDPLLAGTAERTVRYTSYHNEPAHYPPRPPSPGRDRRQTLEAKDQMNFYRDEIAKKDRLIAQLTSMPDTPRTKFADTSKIDEFYSSERLSESATAKSEAAALKVRVDGLQSQVRELHVQLETREEKIRELRLHVETARENEAKHAALVQSLRVKVSEYETQYGSLEGAANRSELAINTLQSENKIHQERVLELESRIRSLTEEKQMAQEDKMRIEQHLTEVIRKVGGSLQVEIDNYHSSTHIENLYTRLNDILTENAMLRGKITSMKEYMQTAEVEHKASRETILRLVAEAEREQNSVSKYSLEMDHLRLEKDRAVAKFHDQEREINLLKERLDASQRSWEATRRELEQKEGRYEGIDIRLRDHELAVRNAEASFKSFKQSLSAILSDSLTAVEPYEECIRERVTKLVGALKDQSAHIDGLERKLTDLANQLEAQCSYAKDGEHKSRRLEGELINLEERLKRAESELAAGEVLKDGLRVDKDRYLRFLERISRAMNMDPITIDMGVDCLSDAIVARAEQMLRLENDAMVDRKTHVYNLQRKVKAMKEQLESKDLHLDLLRKKVATLEEKLVGKSELDREKDEEYVKNRKLVKLVEKYKRELNEAMLEIRDLKAQLLESSEIRNRTLLQERDLESLEVKVGELERVREKQAHKIAGLNDKVHVTESKLGEKREVTKNTVNALTSELRTTKMALDEVTKRERQLLDLRTVLARMLGLDVNTLAVPDYEIISRLEKLILANQGNISTAIALDTVVTDMEDGFRAGYEDATHALNTTKASRMMASQATRSRRRTRSVSPTRKRDTRAY